MQSRRASIHPVKEAAWIAFNDLTLDYRMECAIWNVWDVGLLMELSLT